MEQKQSKSTHEHVPHHFVPLDCAEDSIFQGQVRLYSLVKGGNRCAKPRQKKKEKKRKVPLWIFLKMCPIAEIGLFGFLFLCVIHWLTLRINEIFIAMGMSFAHICIDLIPSLFLDWHPAWSCQTSSKKKNCSHSASCAPAFLSGWKWPCMDLWTHWSKNCCTQKDSETGLCGQFGIFNFFNFLLFLKKPMPAVDEKPRRKE